MRINYIQFGTRNYNENVYMQVCMRVHPQPTPSHDTHNQSQTRQDQSQQGNHIDIINIIIISSGIGFGAHIRVDGLVSLLVSVPVPVHDPDLSHSLPLPH